MPEITSRYKFEYFKRGSLYSGQSDFRRFTTLDYNMESYIGIVGVGVISGWEIEQIDGLRVQVLPGKGVIQGFAVESPYDFKQRSEMVIPEREVEIIETDPLQVPEEDMTDTEKAQYVSVIQDYNSTYNPEGPIENAFVKVVIPKRLELFNDSDNYIYVERSATKTPYPLLTDYPQLPNDIPNARDYANYSDYLVDKENYDEAKSLVEAYKWRDEFDNNFTAIEFKLFSFENPAENRTLIGKVVTRNNNIQEIDLRNVDSLNNMESQIKKFAEQVIEEHNHGGDGGFDPPKIKLETDIRPAIMIQRLSTDVVRYIALSSNRTSVTDGHQHSYWVNSSGNGYTVGVFGTLENHFHKIINYIVQTNEFNKTNIDDHIHTITKTKYSTWDETNRFNVYVNDEKVGDKTSIIATPSSNTFELTQKIGEQYKLYSSTFNVTLDDGEVVTYNFSLRSPTVLSFMLKMQTDFGAKYGKSISVGDPDEDAFDTSKHPFLFTMGDGIGLVGIEDLKNQSNIAETFLIEQGDQFTFTPNAAKNITIILEDVPSDQNYNVSVEILGNSEVQGTIKAENILYLNANKIILGKFDPERIPFIDHIGRMNESCLPYRQYIASQNGIKYTVIPSTTQISLDHSHNVFVNSDLGGVTEQVFIDEDPVFYGTGSDGQTAYLIAHIHGISDGKVQESSSTGLTDWQNDINSTNVATSTHTHELIIPEAGDPKTIYSIQENKNGHIYVGTANGFFMIPNGDAYLYVINGESFYLLGNDLWELLLEAKAKYEERVNTTLVVKTEIYGSQLSEAESELLNEGDSYLMIGATNSSFSQDEVMIKKLNAFQIPNFTYVTQKYPFEIKPGEVIKGVKFQLTSTGEIIDDLDLVNEDNFEDLITIFEVMRFFNDTPIWSIAIRDDYAPNADGVPNGDPSGVAIEDLFVCGSDIISRYRNLESDFYNEWTSPNTPSHVGSLQQIVKDNENNIWVPTNRGLMVSRSYQNGNTLSNVIIPGFSQDIKDVVAGDGFVLCCAGDSIYKTINGGKDWTVSKQQTDGFIELLQETVAGSEDNIYAVSSRRDIFISSNQGESWVRVTTKPSGDTGKTFAFKGKLYVSQKEGIYRFDGGSWEKVFDEQAYSFCESYDGSKFYIGCHNSLYSTVLGDTYTLEYSFTGYPLPIYLENENRSYYGYAYNSLSNTFHFKDFTYISDDTNTSALVDCDRWIASQGPWNENSNYEVFIDNKLVFSTIDGTDKRGTEVESFTVDSSTGILNFGARSNIISNVAIYDAAIEVESTEGFRVGDRVIINSEVELEDQPTIELSADSNFAATILKYKEEIGKWGKRYIQLKEMFSYGTITAISGNFIFLDVRFDRTIETPAYVRKIPRIEGSTEIRIDIYDPLMSNIGNKTHEQIENSLSIASDIRPYQFNNAYLSNLLQLTQAIRYVYPDIGVDHKNNLYYDFHYTEDELADQINLPESEMFSQILYNSMFHKKAAKSINKILIGTGNFSGKLIIGTDIGIFWANIADGLEGNWFYVNTLSKTVYDLIITNDTTLNAGTNDGLYYTTNMIEWTKDASPSITYPVHRFTFRWTGEEVVEIGAHRVVFSNDNYSDPTIGFMNNDNDLYGQVEVDRIIRISGADELDGDYSVVGVTEDRITIRGGFDITLETIYNNVEIIQATWWEQFDGEDYTGTADIDNTLVAGGNNRISYKVGDTIWNEAEIGIKDASFVINDIQPLSNGLILSCATGRSISGETNYLFGATDIGASWDSYFTMEELQGTVVDSSLNEYGNTELTVIYTYPNDYAYVNGVLDLKTIDFFDVDDASILGQSKVVWNDFKNEIHRIIVRGQTIHNIFQENIGLTFKIYPVSIKTIFESTNNTVLLGTNEGIYTDQKTIIGTSSSGFGYIDRLGETGTIEKIDIEATIISVLQNTVSGNVRYSLISGSNVSKNSLIGHKFYIVDSETITDIIITSNTVKSSGGEFVIEVAESYSEQLLINIGKRVVIVPEQSKLFVNFDFPITTGSFNGGKLFITSNENDNIGISYNIVSQNQNEIVVDKSIIPSSMSTTQGVNVNNLEAIAGQSFSILDSSGGIKFYVQFNDFTKENKYSGNNFVTNSISSTIRSNTEDAIILEPFSTENLVLDFSIGDQFEVRGKMLQKLNSFNSKKTSIDLDHYHDLNLVGNVISGEIVSILTNTTGTIISLTNVNGWNDILNADSTLAKDAIVRFYNPNFKGISFRTSILDLTQTQMVVTTLNSAFWDVTGYNESKISPTWKWEIDASLYGYTENTYYHDFNTEEQSVLSDIVRGDIEVEINDTTNISFNDKIEIVDGFGTKEIHYVSSIPDSTHIVLKNEIQSSFFVGQNARVKVLRDFFSNNHTHKVQRNEIENLIVEDYNDRGYPSAHSHRCLPFLTTVNDIIQNGTEVVAVGSSSQVFKSPSANFNYWLKMTDLNTVIEGGEEISAISAGTVYGVNLIAGTTNGYVFSPLSATSVVRLEKPTV
jgi:hypothetical protein